MLRPWRLLGAMPLADEWGARAAETGDVDRREKEEARNR